LNYRTAKQFDAHFSLHARDAHDFFAMVAFQLLTLKTVDFSSLVAQCFITFTSE
jgi:hypothetical protein